MNKYELLFVLPGTLSEDEVGPLVDKVKELLSNAGITELEIIKEEKRRLAYPIKHIRYGYFNIVYFSCEKDELRLAQEKLRMLPDLLRVFIQKIDPSVEPMKKIEFGTPLQGGKTEERVAVRKSTPDKDSSTVNNIDSKKVKEEKKDVIEPKTDEAKEESVDKTSIEENKKVESKEESKKVSEEEIDKKLDEILDIDLSKV